MQKKKLIEEIKQLKTEILDSDWGSSFDLGALSAFQTVLQDGVKSIENIVKHISEDHRTKRKVLPNISKMLEGITKS